MERKIIIQGSTVREEADWTEEQTKKMEVGGFFETAKCFRCFGKVYWLRPSDYKALLTLLFLVDFMVSLMVTCSIALAIQP